VLEPQAVVDLVVPSLDLDLWQEVGLLGVADLDLQPVLSIGLGRNEQGVVPNGVSLGYLLG